MTGIRDHAPPLRQMLAPWALLTPVIVFLLVMFVVPLLQVVRLSFGEQEFSVAGYAAFFSDPFHLRVLGRTLATAAIVTVLCLVLGYPIAYVVARHGGGLGRSLLLIVTMSFWTSFLVRTFAWLVILGNQGPIAAGFRALGLAPPQLLFTTFASTIGMVHILLPFMIMALYSVMLRIDANLVRAAEVLGGSPLQAFARVYLPLSFPGVINGAMMVFIICLGFYVTPELLGGPKDQMIARLIGAQIEQLLDWQEAATMAVVLLGVTLALYAIYDYLFGLDRLWNG